MILKKLVTVITKFCDRSHWPVIKPFGIHWTFIKKSWLFKHWIVLQKKIIIFFSSDHKKNGKRNFFKICSYLYLYRYPWLSYGFLVHILYSDDQTIDVHWISWPSHLCFISFWWIFLKNHEHSLNGHNILWISMVKKNVISGKRSNSCKDQWLPHERPLNVLKDHRESLLSDGHSLFLYQKIIKIMSRS